MSLINKHKTETKKRSNLMKNTSFVKQTPLLWAFMASILSGCTAYNESFDCPVGKGLGCHSITEVKKKLNQGTIDMPETTTEAAARLGRGVPLHPSVVSTVNNQGTDSEGDNSFSFIDSNGVRVERTREKPLRVWIAPYQDQEGNFHEASVVHTIVRGGYWHVQPNPVPS